MADALTELGQAMTDLANKWITVCEAAGLDPKNASGDEAVEALARQ